MSGIQDEQAGKAIAFRALWRRFLPPPPIESAEDFVALARGCVAASKADDVTAWQATRLSGAALTRTFIFGANQERARWAENTAAVPTELEVFCAGLREQHAELTT